MKITKVRNDNANCSKFFNSKSYFDISSHFRAASNLFLSNQYKSCGMKDVRWSRVYLKIILVVLCVIQIEFRWKKLGWCKYNKKSYTWKTSVNSNIIFSKLFGFYLVLICFACSNFPSQQQYTVLWNLDTLGSIGTIF